MKEVRGNLGSCFGMCECHLEIRGDVSKDVADLVLRLDNCSTSFRNIMEVLET